MINPELENLFDFIPNQDSRAALMRIFDLYLTHVKETLTAPSIIILEKETDDA